MFKHGVNAYEEFAELLHHKDFDILNPNRVYSSVRAFNRLNPHGLHRKDGLGYKTYGRLYFENR